MVLFGSEGAAPAQDAAPAAPPPVEAEAEEEAAATAAAGMAGPPAGADAAARDAWLAARVDAAIAARPELAAAKIGVAVADAASGRELVVRRGDDPFNIASNAKLVTAAAALAKLGPEYRFHTALYADDRKPGAKTRPGVLAGDLVLRGGADPTLTHADLAEMVDAVARTGLKTIEGSLVIDATFFDQVGLPPAFAQKLEDAAFRAPVSAVALERDAVVLRIRPGEPGAPAVAEADPPSDYVVVVNEATTVAEGRTALRVAAKEIVEGPTGPARTELRVRGTIRADAVEQFTKKRIWHPERYTGETLRTLLAARGIKVTKKALGFRAISFTARVIASHDSAPLGLIVRELGKHSDNFVAETLLKTLGAESAGIPGTWTNGLLAARAWLEGSAHLAAGSYRMDNGSGLYDASRFTPRQVIAVLRAAVRDFRIGPDYLAALALGGADGTLAKRLVGGPAERLVRAKTGTLKDVICLAGYAGGAGQPQVAFAVLANDVPAGQNKKARALGDEIATAIVLWAGAEAAAPQATAPAKASK